MNDIKQEIISLIVFARLLGRNGAKIHRDAVKNAQRRLEESIQKYSYDARFQAGYDAGYVEGYNNSHGIEV